MAFIQIRNTSAIYMTNPRTPGKRRAVLSRVTGHTHRETETPTRRKGGTQAFAQTQDRDYEHTSRDAGRGTGKRETRITVKDT